MGINLKANNPNGVIAKQTITFAAAGLTADNTQIVFLIDDANKSWVPGRAINGITGFEKGKGYYIIPLVDMDLQSWTMPPIVRPSLATPLIIYTGESNSGGKAQNSLATTGEKASRPSVQILNNRTLAAFENLNIGVGNNMYGHVGADPLFGNAGNFIGVIHGWELGMANRVEAGTFPGGPLYLVKTGTGGSAIADWDVDADYYGTYPWGLFQDRVNAAATLLGDGPIAPYVFYSQGINDAIAGTNIGTWITKTLAHIDKMREFLDGLAGNGAPTPIVMTKFQHPYEAFNNAIDQIVASRVDVYSVVTIDQPVQGDGYHWDYAAMKIIGGRMMDVFLQNYAI